MTDDTAKRRLLVLGANGPTGRLVVEQALERGHGVLALTRHPDTFPLTHERLEVREGDATRADVIDAAVRDTDAIISAIGTAFTRKPVDVYSASARLAIAAMERHGIRRLIVVTSAGVDPAQKRGGVGAALSYTVMRKLIGRTVYDDMVRMEALVSASDAYWTIVRPPGLTDEPGRGYAVAEDEIEGSLCSREDLAALLLDQLDDDRYVRRVAAMSTPGLTVSMAHMVWHEMLKR